MEERQMNQRIQTRASLLCAALAVLAFVLLLAWNFSWMIVILGAVIAVSGMIFSFKSMMGERVKPLPMIGLVVCALMLIALIAVAILSIRTPDPSEGILSSTVTYFN